jgi:hypothetical protein
MKKLINNLLNAKSLEEYETASNACLDFFESATETQKEQIREAMRKKADLITAEAKQTITKISKTISEFEQKDVVLEVNGRKYSLDEWVTLNDYIKKFDLKSTMVVNNWIKRGVVPAENVISVGRLNNLKLIKAVPYLGR